MRIADFKLRIENRFNPKFWQSAIRNSRMYKLLNGFFLVFHTLIVLFCLSGWMFAVTRKYHLALILLIAFSWFVLGIGYGWGYCLFTDWHWQIRNKLGYTYTADSYIHFLALKLTGINFSPRLVDIVTIAGFFVCSGLSMVLNILDWVKR